MSLAVELHGRMGGVEVHLEVRFATLRLVLEGAAVPTGKGSSSDGAYEYILDYFADTIKATVVQQRDTVILPLDAKAAARRLLLRILAPGIQ